MEIFVEFQRERERDTNKTEISKEKRLILGDPALVLRRECVARVLCNLSRLLGNSMIHISFCNEWFRFHLAMNNRMLHNRDEIWTNCRADGSNCTSRVLRTPMQHQSQTRFRGSKRARIQKRPFPQYHVHNVVDAFSSVCAWKCKE